MRYTRPVDGGSESYLSPCRQQDFLCTEFGTWEENHTTLAVLSAFCSLYIILGHPKHGH